MNKYHNKKTEYDGILFDSRKECKYYQYLKDLESAGEISNLQLQKKYVLQDKYRINGKAIREISYICDFYYIDSEGKERVVDVKGVKTPEYKIKKKLFMFKYGIEITEI